MKRELTYEEISLLELYSTFLEHEGYMDTDWYVEEPRAIDRFIEYIEIKQRRNPNLLK